MTLSATIMSVSGYLSSICLHLDSEQRLLIMDYTRVPVVGQRITGTAGHVVIEGGGEPPIMYNRQGSFLTEVAE